MDMRRLIKHNPAFLSDKELVETFVVRRVELDILTSVLRNNVGQVNQHMLVIGSRGMGKTMLVRRFASLVRSDEDLRRSWVPIVVPEEVYGASTEGEIWLAVLKSLVDQEGDGSQQTERWRERVAALLQERDERRLRTQALAALLELSQERGKRLLVIIENVQMLLGEQLAKDADWDLRKTLLNTPEIMLVLTATTRFEQIENKLLANYELFRDLKLEPLSSEDCCTVWESVNGQVLDNRRIRPMEILTGGNPRLLSILASFAPDQPLSALMEDLVMLIDDQTPYLKANIEELSSQERRVFVTLAALWQPSEARQVAARCRLDSNTASAVLKSLVRKGAVVECGKEGRKNLYQVAESLYNVYHLLRSSGSEAERVRALVRFMVPLYGEEVLDRALSQDVSLTKDKIRSAWTDDAEWKEAIAGYDDLIARYPSAEERLSQPDVAAVFYHRALRLDATGRVEEAIAVYDEVVDRFSRSEDSGVRDLVAASLNMKAYALYQSTDSDRLAEAIESAERALSMSPHKSEYRILLASLCAAAGRWTDALEQSSHLVDSKPFLEVGFGGLILLFSDAGADGQAEAALRVLLGTAAESALEPLVVALKWLVGQKVRVPSEVEEVATDVLEFIESRRQASNRLKLDYIGATRFLTLWRSMAPKSLLARIEALRRDLDPPELEPNT